MYRSIYKIQVCIRISTVLGISFVVCDCLQYCSINDVARFHQRAGNDGLRNIGSWSITLRKSLAILATGLSFFCRGSKKAERLEEKHVMRSVWVSWQESDLCSEITSRS